MKVFIAIFGALACACAAPTLELQHPSPVNPDVLVAVKPKEKITLITDPKEFVEFKRETKQPLYPTLSPKDKENHNSEHKLNSKMNDFESKGNNYKKLQVESRPGSDIRNRRDAETTKNIKQSTNNADQETNKENQHILLPLQGGEKMQAPDDLLKDDHSISTIVENPQNPPLSLLLYKKRDIPVPLIPKYHHPEESPKESDKENVTENNKEHNLHSEHVENHVKKEDFQKVSTLPLISKENVSDIEEHKRNIPVPLVQKNTPKENNDSVSHDNKGVHNSTQTPL